METAFILLFALYIVTHVDYLWELGSTNSDGNLTSEQRNVEKTLPAPIEGDLCNIDSL